jgi:Zn-dependent protease/CBS domain-containing protein
MMRSGFRLGRVAGIEIYVDWSWIFIFLLVTWNLAAALFPDIHPEWHWSLNVLLGVLASLLFFGSVLAHELAHSLVAKARGLPVRRITLFLFGGVSNIEREPPTPVTEFLISIVGPITSLLLGLLFIFLGRGLVDITALSPGNLQQMLSNMGPLATILLYLGPVNILLALFNLLPGFPLDGGRVLRSTLWALTGDLRRATRWATLVGQAFAWLLIVAGISMIFGVRIPFLGSGFIGGLWLAFIGWFLNNAASQSYQQVVIQDMLEGVPVSRLMRVNAPVVAPHMTINQLVDDFLLGTDEHAFPVLEGEELVGLVCLEDVRQVPRAEWDNTQVGQIMTPASDLSVVAPREDAVEALRKLSTKDVRQVPVVQNGRLVGMLRRRDILRWLQLNFETGAG